MSGASRSRIGRVLRLATVVLAAAVLILGLYARHLWTSSDTDPSSVPGRGATLRVPAGATLAETADSLVEAGLLERRRVFILGARLSGGDRGIKAGLYEIPAGLSPRDLLDLLVAGATVRIRLTIPEGTTAVETARIVETVLDIPAGAFLAAADSVSRRRAAAEAESGGAPLTFRIPEPGPDRGLSRPGGFHPCEGYLFPETYSFAEGVAAAEVAAVLVDQAFATFRVLFAGRETGPDGVDLRPHDIVTLASIVEAETPLDAEKPKVAAVYLNRLRRGMPLEADPTIAYMLGKTGERILFADLQAPSAYNTYRNRGLPPGPIGNPGAVALEAALRPEPEFDALYFVADGHGGHVFSKTFEEHQAAVERFRILRSKERAASRD